jgi:secernin
MCDTLVALGNATADGSVLFAKNSDRDPNEAHELILVPRTAHPENSSVHCTYIDVPQVAETYAVLLAKPFQIWGAEMGANERGVVIGNESVFTKVPYGKKPGLIGMDFIRLALERTGTAHAALEVITNLLENYGQGGNCGYSKPLYYHNSFILADPYEAWVLETAGQHWAAERVRDVRSISNAITIGKTWDLASDSLVEYAVERGWCKREADFDFGRCYSDTIFTRFSDSRARQCRTGELLLASQGEITVETMIAILRDHGEGADESWSPARGLAGAKVCCHAGPGPIRISQTTGSMVSQLKPDRQTHWLTGTAAPCTGIFKPIWIDAGLPDLGPSPTGRYDRSTLWWRHEALHREVLRDFATRLALYRQDRDALEKRFIKGAADLSTKPSTERAAFCQGCFEEAGEATQRWRERVRDAELEGRLPLLYALAWRRFNKAANIAA